MAKGKQTDDTPKVPLRTHGLQDLPVCVEYTDPGTGAFRVGIALEVKPKKGLPRAVRVLAFGPPRVQLVRGGRVRATDYPLSRAAEGIRTEARGIYGGTLRNAPKGLRSALRGLPNGTVRPAVGLPAEPAIERLVGPAPAWIAIVDKMNSEASNACRRCGDEIPAGPYSLCGRCKIMSAFGALGT